MCVLISSLFLLKLTGQQFLVTLGLLVGNPGKEARDSDHYLSLPLFSQVHSTLHTQVRKAASPAHAGLALLSAHWAVGSGGQSATCSLYPSSTQNWPRGGAHKCCWWEMDSD